MKDNVIELHPASDTLPCDTEPAQGGMVVPTLRAEDSTWLGRWLGRIRRREDMSLFGKCMVVQVAETSNTGKRR